MYLNEIPGYATACERGDRLEDAWRDFSFLGLTITLNIAGGNKIEVSLLTLRMFIQLCAVNSPFLVGGRVGPEHVAQILWRLNPRYGNPDERKDFVAAIAQFPMNATVRAIERYLNRMLIDKPPVPDGPCPKSDTSFAAGCVHKLACNYGWSDDAILDLPMPRLFQYMRRIQRELNSDLAIFNPLRDRFVKRVTDKVLDHANNSLTQ